MKLTRIRIEQFRQFRRQLEIRDLEAGINLFTGPNEAGKSTVVAAIRAAFFERHRSGSVDDLRPWGETSASPTVELDFVVGDTACRLSKSFLTRKRCELQIGAQRLDGADAEDHLAALLGFEHAGKGASKPEHWGIPGLLWIEQGSAQNIGDPVGHATDHLRTALNASLGEVTSSGGDEVLAKVDAARNELLTASTGKPRGAYAEAIEQDAALAARLRVLDDDIASYRQKVDALAALRRDHAEDATARPWEGFRAQQQVAADTLSAIQRIEETLGNCRQRAAQAAARIDLLRRQLDTFAAEEKAVEDRRATLEASHRQQASAAELAAQWLARRSDAETRYANARDTLRAARQADTRRSLARALDDLRSKAQAAAHALAKADELQARLLTLQKQAAAAEIRATDLRTLREQQREIAELRIRQAASATRLHFVLEDGRTMRIGTDTVSGEGERRLVEPTTLSLPGLGRLDIAPGGADLAQLRRDEAERMDAHGALLHRLGLASMDEAEARQQRHQQTLADIHVATAGLKALAPQGTDALRAELAALQARAADGEQALQKQHLDDVEATCPLSVAEAETAEEAAGESLRQIDAGLREAQIAAANTQAAGEAAGREFAAAQARLAAPERAGRLAAANRDLTDARAEHTTLAGQIDALTRQVDEARPDILRQDIERLRRSAEQHERRFNERRDTLLRLDVELQAAGAQGLEEQRAELARDHAQVQRRLAELQRRAAALDHLQALLRNKRRALTRQLQAPLQKHLNRYLQLLFPQASLDIDENLSPGPLTRPGATGPETGAFEALSFGAREQTGIISRLAYADLLREAGRPTLIILDDALVHSDDARLAQMKRVLFDAATRHQILLFTCHPDKWRDMGVAARTLTEEG